VWQSNFRDLCRPSRELLTIRYVQLHITYLNLDILARSQFDWLQNGNT
jgi:hypothetical protein